MQEGNPQLCAQKRGSVQAFPGLPQDSLSHSFRCKIHQHDLRGAVSLGWVGSARDLESLWDAGEHLGIAPGVQGMGGREGMGRRELGSLKRNIKG